jgi:hypothetical protein
MTTKGYRMRFHVCSAVIVCALLMPLMGSADTSETMTWDPAGWAIVVAPDALPSEQYAGREFQQYVRECTGVELPIAEAPPEPTQNVFVGPSAAAGSSSAPLPLRQSGAHEDERIARPSRNCEMPFSPPKESSPALADAAQRMPRTGDC